MRIAITADPEIPVPPKHYGGIERIIHLLINGLVERGHEVRLYAHPDSHVPCELAPYRGATSAALSDTIKNGGALARGVSNSRFDLVHSFGRLAYLLPLLPLGIPKVMSYQRQISRASILWGTRLSRGSLRFTACSRSMLGEVGHLGSCQVVHNAVSPDQYQFRPEVKADAPLMFLGRVEHVKGPHLAVAVAKQSGRRLVIAGNVPETPEHRRYFETEILPHLDGSQIQYAGAVDDAQKSELLGQAAALLMPILWEEPFGIVMAEALACGTPVIGLRRGAVPEVVDDGVTGFICDDVDGMMRAVARIPEIDRSICRLHMERRFSGPVMTEAYLRIYEEMIAHA